MTDSFKLNEPNILVFKKWCLAHILSLFRQEKEIFKWLRTSDRISHLYTSC